MRRIIAAILITATAGFVVGTTQPASAADPASEAAFVSNINALRGSRGIGGVQAHSVLTAKAQDWANHMAATGVLSHSKLTDGISVGWRKLGENVGRGPSISSLHTAFTNSPAHRANMLDGQYRWVGVGVAYGFGQMWVAEVFMDGDPPPESYRNPIGSFENAIRVPGSIAVQGWAIDPDTAGPLNVHVYVDGYWTGQLTANLNRPDVGGAYPNYGSSHGFFGYVPVGAGLHLVCVYAINQGMGTANTQLGCTYVRNTPKGNLDVATPTPNGTAVGGWALGPDTTGPIGVHLYFNGRWAGSANASANRPDIGSAYPGMGSNHGFAAVVPNQTGILCALRDRSRRRGQPADRLPVREHQPDRFARRRDPGAGWGPPQGLGARPRRLRVDRRARLRRRLDGGRGPGQRLPPRPRGGVPVDGFPARLRIADRCGRRNPSHLRLRDQSRHRHQQHPARLPLRHLIRGTLLGPG